MANREDGFDKTQLKIGGHGRTLHRDYSAHFFRWSFARRMIPKDAAVLDVGCGQELPLFNVLTSTLGAFRPKIYTGIDLNDIRLKPTSMNVIINIYEKFNFNEHGADIAFYGKYTHAVCFEVIEHMPADQGLLLLRRLAGSILDDGVIFLSTPCYDGRRHAKNHVHEYYPDELTAAIEQAGLCMMKRYGTFCDINEVRREYLEMYKALAEYYDDDALSCFFAPIINPDKARNNFWILKKETIF
jgi:2-polyprenyl-3-methyl-5-hydroxy-6-metoxy-1,4-benzoquinol methylase